MSRSQKKESLVVSMHRALLELGRKNPIARRLAYSRPGLSILRKIGPALLDPYTKEYPVWRENRLKYRAAMYRGESEPNLLTLATCVWNTPVKYLDVLSRSVQNQDYQEFEWIVLDNG